MKTIKNAAGEVQSHASVIAKYFRKPNENLSSFMAQIKELSASDKEELAVVTAKELGFVVEG